MALGTCDGDIETAVIFEESYGPPVVTPDQTQHDRLPLPALKTVDTPYFQFGEFLPQELFEELDLAVVG
eukprot:CAMPEP_0202469576 /NCGR_PEP_ID=MMETSP1360-20130828/78980_1 /ASSEMBLY_ACC=CAM_ASM_000848 /TAXON_ID=515479 /ORGANISM="Licmophora paradoxa, Strain CCMP2313" /LENGTH=68 /DNA_ID=CAMNT_0049094969 /DNA_START=31 /DNA_END=237 /DNA_ORIENTATION=+